MKRNQQKYNIPISKFLDSSPSTKTNKHFNIKSNISLEESIPSSPSRFYKYSSEMVKKRCKFTGNIVQIHISDKKFDFFQKYLKSPEKEEQIENQIIESNNRSNKPPLQPKINKNSPKKIENI